AWGRGPRGRAGAERRTRGAPILSRGAPILSRSSLVLLGARAGLLDARVRLEVVVHHAAGVGAAFFGYALVVGLGGGEALGAVLVPLGVRVTGRGRVVGAVGGGSVGVHERGGASEGKRTARVQPAPAGRVAGA